MHSKISVCDWILSEFLMSDFLLYHMRVMISVSSVCLWCSDKETVTLVPGGSYLASDEIFAMIRG